MKNTLLLLSLSCTFATSYAADNGTNTYNKKTVQVYGHRGARSFAPENTLPGYRSSLRIGVDWVDMDVAITKDGELLVDHDIWLNPDIVSSPQYGFWAVSKSEMYNSLNTDHLDKNIAPYLVHNLTQDQAQSYDVGVLNPDSPYGKYFPEQLPVPGTHMPTVQQVINYVETTTKNKSIGYQIEIKNDPSHPEWTASPKEFAQKIYAILKQNNLIERAQIQSFDWAPLYELQKLDKRIQTAYLVGYDDKLRMKDLNPKQAGLWSGGKLLRDYNYSLPQMISQLGGTLYEPEDVALTHEEVVEAHRLGLKVVVWSWPEHSGKAFDPTMVAKLIDWRVDGIITDDPGQLNSMLAARGIATPKNYPRAQ